MPSGRRLVRSLSCDSYFALTYALPLNQSLAASYLCDAEPPELLCAKCFKDVLCSILAGSLVAGWLAKL